MHHANELPALRERNGAVNLRQTTARILVPLLKQFPLPVIELIGRTMSAKSASRLLQLSLRDRDLVIRRGLAAGLRFNPGGYNYRTVLGTYEGPVQRAIAENLEQGGVFYDIGANVGFFTILAARCVGSSGRVVAFEPEPGNAALLRRNVERNGFAHVTVMEKAVASQSGCDTLMLTTYCGSHALTRARKPVNVAGEIEIQTVEIDELLEKGQLDPPSLVKIDVEGSEYEVISGLTGTIEKYRPRIIYETDDAPRAFGSREQEEIKIERLLHERGYIIHRLENSYPYIRRYVAHFLALPEH